MCGRTDITKATGALRYYANTPKNGSSFVKNTVLILLLRLLYWCCVLLIRFGEGGSGILCNVGNLLPNYAKLLSRIVQLS
jgi:hypothetical protein